MTKRGLIAAGMNPDDLFGKGLPLPGIISGYAGGTFNMDGTQATPVQQAPSRAIDIGGEPAPEQKKPGFFDQGGIGRSIAGAMGDYLLQANGMRPIYAPQMQEHARALREAAQQMAESKRRRDEFIFEHNYKRDNPLPSTAQPYRFESNDGDVYEMGPQGPVRIFDDPTPRMNFIPDGMGGGRWVPLPGGASNPPILDKLPPNAKPVGGAGPGQRNFPR